MLNVSVDAYSLAALKAALEGTTRKLPREIATAINATAKKVRTEVAREVKKEMPSKIPVSILKKTIKQKSKAGKGSLSATIGFWGGYPIPLKYFNATQTRKGVTFKLNRNTKFRGRLRDAFIARQYGGNVYRRRTDNRGPLEQIKGPAPGEYFEAAQAVEKGRKLAEKELPLQIQRRVRFVLLEAQGGLRGVRPTRKQS